MKKAHIDAPILQFHSHSAVARPMRAPLNNAFNTRGLPSHATGMSLRLYKPLTAISASIMFLTSSANRRPTMVLRV